MDYREIFDRRRWNRNAWDSTRRNREGGKKGERKMTDGVAKFGAIGAIPGIDRIELGEFGNARAFDHAHQVEPGVDDGAGAVGEADQRQDGARRPDFRVIGAGGFKLGKRKNHVADGAGADEQAATLGKYAPLSLVCQVRRDGATAGATARGNFDTLPA